MLEMNRFDRSQLGQRRIAIRKQVLVPVELVSSKVDEPVLHWCGDLTPYGLWLDTRFPLVRGEHVVLCFEPQVWDLEPMMVFAEVTRVRRARYGVRAGMGLSFLDLSDRERNALAGWLRHQPAVPLAA